MMAASKPTPRQTNIITSTKDSAELITNTLQWITLDL